MVKGKRIVCFGMAAVLAAVLIVGLAAASFGFAGESLRRSYAVGENLAGKIIISVGDEPGESMITGDFDGGMGLFDLIKANNLSKSAYSCSTLNCAPKLSASGGAINSLAIESSAKTIGFKINGNGIIIESVNLSIQGDAGQSCNELLSVDIAGKGERIFESRRYGLPCGLKNYGCFNSTLSAANYEDANIGYADLCNKVILPSAPAVEIGAKIKLGTGAVIYADLLDKEGAIIDSCALGLSGSAGTEEEKSCVVNHSITTGGDYQVCVRADKESSGYYMRSETSENKCGTNGRDYEIFARGMAFAANPRITIDSSEDGSIIDYVQGYIDSNYLGDCSNGCVVPFKIYGQAQQLGLNGKIKYSSIESSSIYAISEGVPRINSSRIELDVKHANLTVGSEGNRNYSVYLDGNAIFKIPISVLRTFSFDITPRYSPLGMVISFSAITSENIATGTWNFGDGTTETFYGKNATHKFSAEGEYTIGVDLISTSGLRAAKTFAIQTGNAEDAVASLTEKYTQRIANITSKINLYPLWIANELKTKVDIAALNASVAKAKADFAGNVSAGVVVGNLISLRVPYAIATSKAATYPLAIGYGGIDANLAAQYYGKEISDSDAIEKGIVNWIGKNYDSTISAESISRYDDDGNSVVLNYYTLLLTPKGTPADSTLFINYPLSAIKFKENYGQKEVGDGAAIPLSGNGAVEFTISSPVELSSLGIYMSPDVSEITPISAGPISRALGPIFQFSPILFWLGFGILLVLFLIGYIVLQEWFKRNREKGLFPNSDELYNIVTFIHNSRRKAMGDGEIRKNLEKSGWRKQQIDYALDKIEGKRAIFEIPIFRAVEQKKLKDEIAKRSGGPIGLKRPEITRFIKR